MAGDTTAATATTPAVKPGRLWIGGEYVDAADGATFDVWNPATEEKLTTCAAAGPADVDRAVKSAREAFAGAAWSRMTPLDRQRILWNVG